MSLLKQITLDGSPYIERDCLNRPLERAKKTTTYDYVLAVFGSRSMSLQATWIFEGLDEFVARKRRGVKPIELVIGDSRGVTAAASEWARVNNVPLRMVSATPDYYDKWPRAEFHNTAVAHRDEDIVNLADVVVCFWEQKPKKKPLIMERADRFGKLAAIYFLSKDCPIEIPDF